MNDNFAGATLFVEVGNPVIESQVNNEIGYAFRESLPRKRACIDGVDRYLRLVSEDDFGTLMDLIEEGAEFKLFWGQFGAIKPFHTRPRKVTVTPPAVQRPVPVAISTVIDRQLHVPIKSYCVVDAYILQETSTLCAQFPCLTRVISIKVCKK